jgi:hypothetical protein
VLAGTVTDGSITWTAEAYAVDSLLDGIDSDSWSVSSPTGLTVAAGSPVISAGQQLTRAVLSEGVSGVKYSVENVVVTDLGHEYVARVVLKIE